MIPDSQLETELRQLLQAQEPPRDLLPGVMARLTGAGQPARPPRRVWMWALAAAAVLAVALTGSLRLYQQQQAREQMARADAQQVTHALQVASADLVRIQRQLSRTAPRTD